MGSRGGRVRRGLITAMLVSACAKQGSCVGVDAPGPPTFVDAPTYDAGIGGESTYSLYVYIFLDAEAPNRTLPSSTDLGVVVFDYTDELVAGALVDATWEGRTVPVPELDTGFYVLTLDGYVPRVEIDIHRDPDYLRDVRLEMPALHSITIDPTSMVTGVPFKMSWEPSGDPRVLEPYLYAAKLDPFDIVLRARGLTDSGFYESPETAFYEAGRYEAGLSREIEVRLNSYYSRAYLRNLVYEQFDVAWAPGHIDAAPIDAPVALDAMFPDSVPNDGSPVVGVPDAAMPD